MALLTFSLVGLQYVYLTPHASTKQKNVPKKGRRGMWGDLGMRTVADSETFLRG